MQCSHIFFSDFPKHPTDRLVNQIVRVGNENSGDMKCG